MLNSKFKKIILFLLIGLLAVSLLPACGKQPEEETTTEEVTVPETTTPQVTTSEDSFPTVTAMGITVPQYMSESWISLYDCIYFAGPYVTQDGSWEWIDAADTTPKRGDLVVYYAETDPTIASHESVCIVGYKDGVYMNIDGNYGEEPGGLWKGRYDSGVPNKHWPDSYPNNPGNETALGVYRAKDPRDAELMARAAEAVYDEYNIIGQDLFLKKYMPEFYLGVWCYYLVPIAVNAAARHKVDLSDYSPSQSELNEYDSNMKHYAPSGDNDSTETTDTAEMTTPSETTDQTTADEQTTETTK